MAETSLEVLFAPAEFAALEARDLSETTCVVFDVLRATSTIVTALANGAQGVIPVLEISEALALREQDPRLLLAGEREGLRIMSDLTGGVAFDLGNSPREFTPEKVQERTIVMTTTNGTRALRACRQAWAIYLGSFLNLDCTADLLQREPPAHLLVVCSGTFDQAAYEDVLGAGALCDVLFPNYSSGMISDLAEVARNIFLLEQADLGRAMARSRNARRLLSRGDLCRDVPFCLQRNVFSLVAELGPDGVVRRRI